jgi:hypothetical protein
VATPTDLTPYDSCAATCDADGKTCLSNANFVNWNGIASGELGVCTDTSTCTTGVVSKNGADYISGCATSSYTCATDVTEAAGYVESGRCEQSSCCTSNYIDTDNSATFNSADAACNSGGSAYNGLRCASSSANILSGTFDGIWAVSNCGAGNCHSADETWSCVTANVLYDGTYYVAASAAGLTGTDGYQCRNGAVGSGGFAQNGQGYGTTCQTSGNLVCQSGTGSTCTLNCASGTGGQKCDTTLTSGGAFFGEGVCARDYTGSSWICDTANPTSYGDCGLGSSNYCYQCYSNGFQCDSTIANSNANAAIDGRCYGLTSCCTAAYVDANDDSGYNDAVCGCSASYPGYKCVTSGGGNYDGYCTDTGSWTCKPNNCVALNAGGQFKIQSAGGTNMMILDKVGNVESKGKIKTDCATAPSGNYWSVELSGATKAWIDSVNGDLCLSGKIYSNQGGTLSPPAGSFIIRDNSDAVMAYIDGNTGNLYAKGEIASKCTI